MAGDLIQDVPPRLKDWRPRLVAWLAEATPASFRPGSQDCALFVAGAVRAMTGHDPAAPFRGTYTRLEDGFERLRRAGFADPVALADRLFPRVPLAFAQMGDLAAIPVADGMAMAVVLGETLACLNPAGLAQMPRGAAAISWRVA